MSRKRLFGNSIPLSYSSDIECITNICAPGDNLHIQHKFSLGGKTYVLSTVFLDYCYYNGRYETMVFNASETGKIRNWKELYCERYWMKGDAIKRHEELIKKIENGEKFWEA